MLNIRRQRPVVRRSPGQTHAVQPHLWLRRVQPVASSSSMSPTIFVANRAVGHRPRFGIWPARGASRTFNWAWACACACAWAWACHWHVLRLSTGATMRRHMPVAVVLPLSKHSKHGTGVLGSPNRERACILNAGLEVPASLDNSLQPPSRQAMGLPGRLVRHTRADC